jgi:hypothetical protein
MRVIYEAENLIDAHLVRGRLASEGVEALVRGEFLTGAMGELPMSGLLAVCVAEQQAERALQLLADWRSEDAAAPALGDDEDWDVDPGAAAFVA